jgi:hypothetical protein
MMMINFFIQEAPNVKIHQTIDIASPDNLSRDIWGSKYGAKEMPIVGAYSSFVECVNVVDYLSFPYSPDSSLQSRLCRQLFS